MENAQKISRPGTGDIALLFLLAIVWASAFSAIKIAVAEVGPIWTAALRVSIGFLAVLPIALFTGIRFPRQLNLLFFIILIAALNMVIPFALISWGLQSIDAGVAALLMGTTPFIAMVLGHFFTSDEKINRFKIIGVSLGLTGILTIFGADAVSGLGLNNLSAQLAVVAGASCYVISGLFMRRINMKPIEFTVIALFIGSAMLLSAAFLSEGVPVNMPSENVLWALIWLGVFPTGLAYVLRFYLVKRVGVGAFALGMNTVPVFGLAFGALLLGEQITSLTLAALFLVISGLLIARLGTPKKQPILEPK